MTVTPSADALLAAMEAAALRVERYLDMRAKHPMRQLGQVIHAVHGGHEDAADLLLADLQVVMKALRASQEREAAAVAALAKARRQLDISDSYARETRDHRRMPSTWELQNSLVQECIDAAHSALARKDAAP